MARRVFRRTLPQFPSPPKVPETPLQSRRFERAGREIRPLAGPDIPIPAVEDENLERRYEQWQAIYNGSVPEFIAWEWLVYVKKQRPNVDFLFQHPLFGGRTEFGGFVLDFFFPHRFMGWRVQGERFHLLQPEDRARDNVARALLEGRGIHVVDLWEDDLLTRAEFVLEKAWEGQQVQGRLTVG